MRKLSLISLVVALASVGCGSSGNDDKDNNNGNGKGDAGLDSGSGSDIELPPVTDSGTEDPSGIKPKYPECPKEMIPATFDPYEGPKPFSREEFMACQEKCGDDNSCFTEENCPGIDTWDDCANAEIIGCSGAEGGKCRTGYENFVCCAAASECADDDIECVQTKCAADLTAFQDCFTNDQICLGKIAECFGDDPLPGEGDAGSDGTDGTEADAGAGDGDAGASNKSRSSFNLSLVSRVLEALRLRVDLPAIKQ